MEPHLGVMPAVNELPGNEAGMLLSDRKQHLDKIKEHLARAQNRMKMQADKNRKEMVFHVGEQVLLKLQPYAQSSLVNRPCHKLAYKYFGPYKIVERIGEVAYKLDLPYSSLIHPVFHVSQLKPPLTTLQSTPICLLWQNWIRWTLNQRKCWIGEW